jgi:hypothetical protein
MWESAMSRTTPVLALVALTLLGTSACDKKDSAPASTAATTPKPQDESAWRVYEQKSVGFAVALPPTWEAIPLDPKTLDQNLAEAIRRTPELRNAEEQIRKLVAGGVVFFALDKSSLPTGSTTNLNVAKAPHEGPASLDEAVKDMLKVYGDMPGLAGHVMHRSIQLHSGQDAECISYKQTTISAQGRPDSTAFNQYVVLRGRQVFLLNFATKAQKEAENKPSFDNIAQSFRFLDK